MYKQPKAHGLAQCNWNSPAVFVVEAHECRTDVVLKHTRRVGNSAVAPVA